MLATFAGTLIVFLLCGVALTVGQWFGRPPVEGRCGPVGNGACGSAGCCRLDGEPRER